MVVHLINRWLSEFWWCERLPNHRCSPAAVFPLEGSTSILIDVGATKTVAAAAKCSCRTGGDCTNPSEYVDVSDAIESYSPVYRDMDVVSVEIKVGEVLLFADRVMHAGGAATNPVNRRIFFAAPFGSLGHLLENDVVVLPNPFGRTPQWFDGSKKFKE